MRTLKRLAYSGGWFGSIAICVLLVFFVALGIAANRLPGSDYLTAVFVYSVPGVVAGCVMFVRAAQRWEFAFAVEDYAHRRRSRIEKLTQQVVLWIPSGLAAFVLFCFPQATHLAHLRSDYLTHYRVPIPWNVAVYDISGFLSPEFEQVEAHVWDDSRREVRARMVFGSAQPERRSVAFTKQFRLADGVMMHCRQTDLPSHKEIRDVACWTEPEVGPYNFYAGFLGQETELPLFYSTLSGVSRRK